MSRNYLPLASLPFEKGGLWLLKLSGNLLGFKQISASYVMVYKYTQWWARRDLNPRPTGFSLFVGVMSLSLHLAELRALSPGIIELGGFVL